MTHYISWEVTREKEPKDYSEKKKKKKKKEISG